MNVQRKLLAMCIAMAGATACISNPAVSDSAVVARPSLPIEVTVQGDRSGKLREFPVNGDAAHYRAYLQAVPEERYRVRIANNTGERVGVVVAVDGRNIISGKQSWLRNTERMYILAPYSSGSYEGWRSSSNQVNRFFFTEAGNSYAAAWGDTSAMGVIAMAAYPERPRPLPMPAPMMAPRVEEHRADAAAAAPAPRAAPGTGYGESTYSPSHSVEFEPQANALEKVFLKYEWRDTLCTKHVLPECRTAGGGHGNRMWPDNGGFAPPPPHR